jgi:hypothetical protein
VGHGADEGGERADFVIAAFEEAVARHGRPEMVMSDKGAAFWSWKGVSRFTALLTELGHQHALLIGSATRRGGCLPASERAPRR